MTIGRVCDKAVSDQPPQVATTAAPGNGSSGTAAATVHIGLLTGGGDPHYSLGLATSLAKRGVRIDFIGSNDVGGPILAGNPFVRFLNLRGDQSTNASLPRKAARLLAYYICLIRYAAVAKPKVFHILWNNKFEHFDRTAMMLWYRLFGRRIVMTAHNVNAAKRDKRDSLLNRLTLGIQYRLCAHVFVHTERMRDDLRSDFGISPQRISVVPFGVNNAIPTTELARADARQLLGLSEQEQVLLFFGQIAPYKGLKHLVAALPIALRANPRLRLVIAGKVKEGHGDYWSHVQHDLHDPALAAHLITRIEHIPDDEIEPYFKAADVVVMPYEDIYQSGILLLAYSFGLPVIATDVGALREDIVEGRTGLICRAQDPADIARAVESFFSGPLHANRERVQADIKAYVNERNSWAVVASISESVYLAVCSGA